MTSVRMVSKFVSWLAGGFDGHSWLVGAETCLLLVGWVGGLLGSGEAEVPRQETELATSVGRCAQLNHLQTKDLTVRLFTRESWGVGSGLCSVGRGGGRPQISFHCGCLGGLWPKATSWGCQGPGILALEVRPSPEAEPSGGALEGTGWAAREDDGSPVQVGGWDDCTPQLCACLLSIPHRLPPSPPLWPCSPGSTGGSGGMVGVEAPRSGAQCDFGPLPSCVSWARPREALILPHHISPFMQEL